MSEPRPEPMAVDASHPSYYMTNQTDPATVDVVLVMDDGTELVAHASVLRRMFGLFANVIDDIDIEGDRLRIPVRGQVTTTVAKLLCVAYHVASLTDLMDGGGVERTDASIRSTLLTPVWRDRVPTFIFRVSEDAVDILGSCLVPTVVDFDDVRDFVIAADFLELYVLKQLLLCYRNPDEYGGHRVLYKAVSDIPGLDSVRVQSIGIEFGIRKRHYAGQYPTLADIKHALAEYEGTDVFARVDYVARLMQNYHDPEEIGSFHISVPTISNAVMLALCEGSDLPIDPLPENAVPVRLNMLFRFDEWTCFGRNEMQIGEATVVVSFHQDADIDVDLWDEDDLSFWCELNKIDLPTVRRDGPIIKIMARVYDKTKETYATVCVHTENVHVALQNPGRQFMLPFNPIKFFKKFVDPFASIYLFAEVVTFTE
jgi:hypothetical protein